VPAAFIIARDGTIRFVYSNPDPENSIEAKKLLAAAKEAAK
jgi:peroxiredoxin